MEFYTLHDAGRSRCSATTSLEWPHRRGPAPRRGHAPADDPGRRPLRRSAAGRRTARRSGWSCRGSTASRTSSRSSGCASSSVQPAQHLAARWPAGIRLLRQREPDGGSPALEPGARGAPAVASSGPTRTQMFNGYADQVQRPLRRDGSAEELLRVSPLARERRRRALPRHRRPLSYRRR